MFWYKWNREKKELEWTCEEAKKEYEAYKATLPKISLVEFSKNPNILSNLRRSKEKK